MLRKLQTATSYFHLFHLSREPNPAREQKEAIPRGLLLKAYATYLRAVDFSWEKGSNRHCDTSFSLELGSRAGRYGLRWNEWMEKRVRYPFMVFIRRFKMTYSVRRTLLIVSVCLVSWTHSPAQNASLAACCIIQDADLRLHDLRRLPGLTHAP